LKDHKGALELKLNSNWQHPEFVTGVEGTGLRTDGYSTWLTGSLPAIASNPVSINGWFALESYPTDTAAFFVLSDSKSGTAVSACIDRFGKPLMGIKQGNVFNYYASTVSLPRFKWIHVGLQCTAGKAELFINGQKLQSVNATPLNPMTPDQLLVGRDVREKAIGMFPVTAINGIIDEVEISAKPLQLHKIATAVKNNASRIPKLAIPAVRFAKDFSRPQYHLLPASNWTNETHGFIYYKSRYHIFNQKNASNLFLGQINWGHFSSPDLVTWTEHKPALTPEPAYDENGIWSGHVVLNDKGVATIIYTAGSRQMGIGLAFPKDTALIEWQKFKDNPVIKGQPDGFSRTDLRDPFVFREGGKWYMIVGFGVKDNNEERGAVLLYTSTDLKKWNFLHTLFEGNPAIDNSGIFWEMPVFLKMNNKYIFLVNKVPHKGVPAVALYWTGDFVNEKFVPDNRMPQKLEVVNRLLSPSVAVDKNGLVTTIAIIPDEIGSAAAYKNGWTHVYSIPRVWTFENGKINQSPHPSLRKLTSDSCSIAVQTVTPAKNLLISKGAHQLEIETRFSLSGCRKFGFVLAKDSTGREFTKIYYDFDSQEFIVDQANSSRREHIPLDTRSGKYQLDKNAEVQLHVFIDGSVVEVFINNKDAFTTRIFPLSEASNIVEVFTEGGAVKLEKAIIRKLKSANNQVDF
jgi:beta-fructofuranosidase